MIPAQAVDAAIAAWSKIETRTLRGRMYEALEAAAPHMLNRARVTTEEELDALPVGAVVLSDSYTYGGEGCDWPVSFQKWPDGYWHRGARSGSTHPDNFLPALILHRPAP